MRSPSSIVLALLLAITATLSVSCQSAAKPGKFTEADIAKLKWIEGSWRGTGEKQAPFFERYRIEGSTMIVDSYGPDETMQKLTESDRFELIDGEFGKTDGDKRSAASTITDTAVQFIPVRGIRYSFRFEKQPDATWRAVIENPANGDKPASTIIYKMEPWPKK